jgi:asparaginyl-tRNA synthetase
MSSARHGGWTVTQDRFLKILDDPMFRLLVDLQDLVTGATTDFWRHEGARNMHLPITTSSVSSPMGLGSDSLPVKIDLFGVSTYLADSMQFLLEYGCRLSADGAWYLMPSFRGEDADRTHLNQFFHSEAEIAGGLDDVMEVAERYVRYLAQQVLNQLGERVREVVGRDDHLRRMVSMKQFPRLTLDEALAHLGDDADAVVHNSGGWRTLTRHGERRLMNEVSPFVWVSHFDHLAVPFYQAYADNTRRSSLNADLLFGIGEVVGSGERHVTGEQARKALVHHEVSEKDYAWYIQMKDERPMRTSGFGLGVERWLMWVLDHDDIRELQLLPRLNGVDLVP